MATTNGSGWWVTRYNESGTLARISRHDGQRAARVAARALSAKDPDVVYEIREETSDGGVVFSARVEPVGPPAGAPTCGKHYTVDGVQVTCGRPAGHDSHCAEEDD